MSGKGKRKGWSIREDEAVGLGNGGGSGKARKRGGKDTGESGDGKQVRAVGGERALAGIPG